MKFDPGLFPIKGECVLLKSIDGELPEVIPIKLSTFSPVEGFPCFYDHEYLKPWIEQETEEVQKNLKAEMTKTIGYMTDLKLMPDGRYYGEAYFTEDTPIIKAPYVLHHTTEETDQFIPSHIAYLTTNNSYEYGGFSVDAELFFNFEEKTPSGRVYTKDTFDTGEDLSVKRYPVFIKAQDLPKEATSKDYTLIKESHYQFHIGEAEMLYHKEGDLTVKFDISLNNLGRKLLCWFQAPIKLNLLGAYNVGGEMVVRTAKIIYLFLHESNKFKPAYTKQE